MPHKVVCRIQKRAFVEGLSCVLEAFIPVIQIQYANVSFRSIDPEAACVEAFHVQTPW